jgi:outer membrane murein-binding lipoprotein Lpp
MSRFDVLKSEGAGREDVVSAGTIRSTARAFWFPAAVLSVVLMTGCGSTAPVKSSSASVPAVPTLQQHLDDAARAHAEGTRIKERAIYRSAAAAYPTSKEPWLKLAEGYFEESDYGNAILAAQEVLQRDSNDNVATSLLAVSGLRVSTSALKTLRQQNNLGSDTRSQAENAAKILRDVLGEPVLASGRSDSGGNSAAGAPANPAPPKKPSKPVPPPAPKKPDAAPSGGNPFDKLK